VRGLERALEEALRAVPRGRVTTYGDLAASLGDPVAARAVAAMLRESPHPRETPVHRVVLADGSLGGDSATRAARARALEREGVLIEGGRVARFERLRAGLIPSDMPLRALQREQGRLRAHVSPGPLPWAPERYAGVDVAYAGEREAFAAAVEVDAGTFEVLRERVVRVRIDFPYIPTYLAVRELPAIEAALDGWDMARTVLFIDGQGSIHPRGFGIACHVGVALGVPTVGVAKSLLWGAFDAGAFARDGHVPVVGEGIHAGWAIRPPRGRPVFASPGTMVSLDEALEITMAATVRRQPVPLELAHRLATSRRGQRG
jgi:deoxyribonuclease V